MMSVIENSVDLRRDCRYYQFVRLSSVLQNYMPKCIVVSSQSFYGRCPHPLSHRPTYQHALNQQSVPASKDQAAQLTTFLASVAVRISTLRLRVRATCAMMSTRKRPTMLCGGLAERPFWILGMSTRTMTAQFRVKSKTTRLHQPLPPKEPTWPL